MSSGSGLPRPCVACGEPTTATRCAPCGTVHDRAAYAAADAKRPTTAGRGYGARWQRLSKRARALQPWCEDCGNSHPDDLTTDHSPEAWRRVAAGLPIRLRDVAVVCRPCNSARGAARGPGIAGDR